MINYEEHGDITMHLPVFYTITRALKPKCILEIGIRGGVSTRAFTQAIEDGNLNCKHHCCDINPNCRKVAERLGGIFHGMDSNKLAEQWNDEIDILFIDGCHEYNQVKKDFENFFPYVRKNGIIFFHDTFPPPGKKDDPGSCWNVYRILDDLYIGNYIRKLEYVTLPYQNGVTICRKLN